VATAVVEAIARKKKIAKPIIFSANVGNHGNLRLSFSNPVALPSYLKIESKTEKNQTEKNQIKVNP
jgi:hypothetical protein